MRTIKKYPNRRLYDTEQSRYITLSDLQQLVMEGEEFQVVDANSGADLTRNILLQIISEQESGANPIFTSDILMRIIRFYDNSVQSTLTQYLEQSLNLFTEQQKAIQDQLQGAMDNNPVASIMNEMTRRNLEIWQNVQSNFFSAIGTPDSPHKKQNKSD